MGTYGLEQPADKVDPVAVEATDTRTDKLTACTGSSQSQATTGLVLQQSYHDG